MSVRGMGRRVGWLVAFVLVAGCLAPVSAEVASGTFDDGGWSAWVSRTFDQGTCLEIRALGRSTAGICGLEVNPTNSEVMQLDAPPGGERLLAGIVSQGPAVQARVTLRDGRVADAPVSGVPSVTSLRFYVVVLPPDVEAVSVDLLDGAGTILQTVPLG